MHPQVILYLICVLISATATTVLGVYPLRQGAKSSAAPFAWLMLCATLWSVTAALEVISSELYIKTFWFIAKFSIVSMTPMSWLAVALEYSGNERWLRWKRFAALSIFSFLGSVLVATNTYHHWMFSDLVPQVVAGMQILNPGYTPLLLVYTFYSLGILLVSVWLFFDAMQRAPTSYKAQSFTLILSLFIPMIVAALYTLRISPLFPLDPMPIAFVFSGGILLWSLFRHQLFDIMPVARDKVIESMGDGMVVVEAKGRILDLNPVAQQVIRCGLADSDERIIGGVATSVLRAWPAWVECYSAMTSARVEINVNKNEASRIYDVDISPLTDRRQHFLGWVAMLRDVTEQKQIHERLQSQFAEIVRLQQQLTEQAIRDPLTNLYNRRYLEEILEHEFARAARGNYCVCLVMIDIDRFKNVNDTFGHQAGDLMLQILAKELCAQIRAGDFVCRYGGEEFVVVMPNIPIENATARAEQWRASFEKLYVKYLGADLHATLSLGIAAYPAHGRTSGQVLRAADHQLYAAKSAGRNCVRVAQT